MSNIDPEAPAAPCHGDWILYARRLKHERDQARKIIESFGSWLDHWSTKWEKNPADVYEAWDEARQPKKPKSNE